MRQLAETVGTEIELAMLFSSRNFNILILIAKNKNLDIIKCMEEYLLKIILYASFIIFTTYRAFGSVYKKFISAQLTNRRKYKDLKEIDYLKYQYFILLKPIFLSVKQYEVAVGVGVWYLSKVFMSDALHGNTAYIQEVNKYLDEKVIFLVAIVAFIESMQKILKHIDKK